jgi:thiamine-monophosphate kinase
MSLSEFDLIRRCFSHCGNGRSDVLLGVGDDAALLQPPPDMLLAVTQDTLVAGVHFPADPDPEALGHKSLAVNLSDLAAMGATPAWVTLGLTLPQPDLRWLDKFSVGLCALAVRHGVHLVGGDTTRGPLAISVTAVGFVPPGAGLRRGGARAGDLVCLTGTLGDAGLALRAPSQDQSADDRDYLRGRLQRPSPRVDAGMRLRPLASAAIDVSDGLAADLGHILDASGVGAVVELARIPCSEPVRRYLSRTGDWSLPLSSGDDYELCFTLPRERLSALDRLRAETDCGVTVIGSITEDPGLRLLDPDARTYRLEYPGYDHFGGTP